MGNKTHQEKIRRDHHWFCLFKIQYPDNLSAEWVAQPRQASIYGTYVAVKVVRSQFFSLDQVIKLLAYNTQTKKKSDCIF